MSDLLRVGNRLDFARVSNPIVGPGTIVSVKRRRMTLLGSKDHVLTDGGLSLEEVPSVAQFIMYCCGVTDFSYYVHKDKKNWAVYQRFIFRAIDEPVILPGTAIVTTKNPVGFAPSSPGSNYGWFWKRRPHPAINDRFKSFECSTAAHAAHSEVIARVIADMLGLRHQPATPNAFLALEEAEAEQ